MIVVEKCNDNEPQIKVPIFKKFRDKRKAKKGSWRIPEKTLLIVALLATCNSEESPEIFCNAEIKPSGFLVNSIAVASAKNSLFLETASCINLPKIGANIKNINPIIPVITPPIIPAKTVISIFLKFLYIFMSLFFYL